MVRFSVVTLCLALSLGATTARACMNAEVCRGLNLELEYADKDVPASAQRAFARGDFFRAAQVAEASNSASALAFAARAHTADAVMRDTPCEQCLLDAVAAAEAAIKRDPSLAEGYVQLAVAIGFRGRLLGAVEAQSEGLAEKGRAAIDRALELDPLNLWARASLGGWHLEVVRRAGPILAKTMYGAREADGLQNFRAALTKAPANSVLHFHYALSILALDQDRFRKDALAALHLAEWTSATDELTRHTSHRAYQLRKALKARSDDEVEALVRKFQGYPPEP